MKNQKEKRENPTYSNLETIRKIWKERKKSLPTYPKFKIYV